MDTDEERKKPNKATAVWSGERRSDELSETHVGLYTVRCTLLDYMSYLKNTSTCTVQFAATRFGRHLPSSGSTCTNILDTHCNTIHLLRVTSYENNAAITMIQCVLKKRVKFPRYRPGIMNNTCGIMNRLLCVAYCLTVINLLAPELFF